MNFKLKLMLQHTSENRINNASQPYVTLEMEKMAIFNTNSQWQEITDLGKMHVINEATGEALAFKRMIISGLSLLVFDSAQIPFSTNSAIDQPCRMLSNVRVVGGFAAKRGPDWKLLSYKGELEVQELKVLFGRRELFMVRQFFAGLIKALQKSKEDKKKAQLLVKEQLSWHEEHEEEQDDEETALEGEEGDFDSILGAHKAAWTAEDDTWNSYIDNSLCLYIKQAEMSAHQDEESDSPGFVILLSLFQVTLLVNTIPQECASIAPR